MKRAAEASAEAVKEPKKSRGEFDPKAEAQPLSRREVKPQIPSMATSKESEGSLEEVEPEGDKAGTDEVFFPGNKTVADMSIGSNSDQVFELALEVNPQEALSMADSPEQRQRAMDALAEAKSKVSRDKMTKNIF